MGREKLKKLAQDKRIIRGIYNYCDRWCERCPFTSRCLNFATSEEDFSDPETQDIRNEKFWKKMSESFQVTMQLLKEAAEEQGIDRAGRGAGSGEEAWLTHETEKIPRSLSPAGSLYRHGGGMVYRRKRLLFVTGQ